MKFDRKLIIIIAVALVVLVLGAYLLYRAGKRSADSSKVKPPKDDVGAGNLTDEKYDEINSLAVNLFNDMDGANWNWEEIYYERAVELSDEELAVLNNVFNEKYESDSGQTFLQWLQGEQFWWNDYALQQKVTVLISRLVGIGAS